MLLNIMEDEIVTLFILMKSFDEYVINEPARVPSKSSRKTYLGKEVIYLHQVEETTKFVTFRNL